MFANQSFVKTRCYDIYILSRLPPVFLCQMRCGQVFVYVGQLSRTVAV